MACPLNVFSIVLRPGVLAAHLLDVVEALGISTNAFELWECGGTTMRGLVATAESEGSDSRKQDCTCVFLAFGECPCGQGRDDEAGEMHDSWRSVAQRMCV